MGNDDARIDEIILLEGEKLGLFNYANQKKIHFREYVIYGYSFIPPSPFQLKDWEKYDVSRYVDPGCVPPTEGFRTTDIDEDEIVVFAGTSADELYFEKWDFSFSFTTL